MHSKNPGVINNKISVLNDEGGGNFNSNDGEKLQNYWKHFREC